MNHNDIHRICIHKRIVSFFLKLLDVLGTDGRIIPRARFTDTTNFLHLGRDHGFEEEFKVLYTYQRL